MMRGTLSGIVGLGRALAAVALMAAALQSAGFAQTPARRQTQTRSGQSQSQSEADAKADLSITARVTAESLRFEKVPNPRVEFTGRPERQTVWESERENLPQEVRPGVTYRDIGITLRITSVFADIDRIVAEALGEVTPSDDTRPAATPQTPPANTRPPASDTPTPATNTPPASSTPPSESTSSKAQSTLKTQSPESAAAPPRRRVPARRGRVN
jgi:hypothetical protein